MGMSWLNPIALWGLSALAIPILIHLWSKNKTKEIAFGSIRFLRESSTLQSKKIQISEIPLLLLRLLILILLVLLLAKWVNYQEVEKTKALMLGTGVDMPQTYINDEIPVFRTSEFGENSNRWLLLEELSSKHPEIDSLIYIDDFQDTDFIGAIPKLSFHLDLIPSSNSQNKNQKLSLDTLLIHFQPISETAQEKFNKVLKANHLYTKEVVSFRSTSLGDAQLIFTQSPQKLNVNQIVLTDTISSDYLVQTKQNHSILYLNEEWMQNPLHEDLFLSVVTEFLAQIVEPNYQYSSFESIYIRKSKGQGQINEAQSFDEELLWLIVFLIMLERYFSYRKKHA
jgi:hypothetical protein